MSFVDLMKDITYTPYQISKIILSMERGVYTKKAERDLTLIGTAVALTKRPVHPHEDNAINSFNTFMEGMEQEEIEATTDNQLLIDTLEYEAAVVRLDKYILLDGQEGQEYQAPTYDPETGEELTPEIPYIPHHDPLPEFITVPIYDDDGNQIGTEEIRNPPVVQDEEERSNAQNTIDNANQEVLDLVILRQS